MKNDSFKSWRKTLGCIVLLVLAFGFGVACLLGAGLGMCSYKSSATEKVFDTIHVGDTKEAVVAKMGAPSDIEPPFAKYGRYDAQKCQGACVERLWYEHRICLDEAWLVELDKNNKVIATGHIVSP
jgi:hypothetical protein